MPGGAGSPRGKSPGYGGTSARLPHVYGANRAPFDAEDVFGDREAFLRRYVRSVALGEPRSVTLRRARAQRRGSAPRQQAPATAPDPDGT